MAHSCRSVGEPSTQMTLNTFHFAGELLTRVYPIDGDVADVGL
jgi:hypothetical protein